MLWGGVPLSNVAVFTSTKLVTGGNYPRPCFEPIARFTDGCAEIDLEAELCILRSQAFVSRYNTHCSFIGDRGVPRTECLDDFLFQVYGSGNSRSKSFVLMTPIRRSTLSS